MTTLGEQGHICRLWRPGPPTPDGAGGYTQSEIDLDPPRAYFAITPAAGVERSVAATVEASARWHLAGALHPRIDQYTRIDVLEGVYAGRSLAVQSFARVLGDRGELPYRLALECTEVLA